MNYIDLVLVSICIYGLVKGYINGLVKEITGTLSLFISFYVASSFYTFFDPYFSNYISEGPVKSLVVFGFLFLLTLLCVRIIGFFLDKAASFMALGLASKLLGAVFGFLKLYTLCGLILFFESQISLFEKKIKQESVLYNSCYGFVKKIAPDFDHKEIKNSFDKKKDQIEEKLNLK